MIRFTVNEYIVQEKGRNYSVLVFPKVEHMWAFDDHPEEDCYMVDGSAEAFSMLKYAMAILVEASDKIIYFPCKQNGIGRYYKENYNLILCTPKAQLRRSLWIAIRRKLNLSTKRGSYVLQYNRQKLDDFCRKKLLSEECGNIGGGEFLKPEIFKKVKSEHYEEVLGENLFMVLGQTECYYAHFHIAKDLDELNNEAEYGTWTALGWILTQKSIADMYDREKEAAQESE